MGEIVNLRRERRRRARADEAAEAAASRARRGGSKAQREAIAREARRAQAALDGARLQPVDQAMDELQLLHDRRGEDERI